MPKEAVSSATSPKFVGGMRGIWQRTQGARSGVYQKVHERQRDDVIGVRDKQTPTNLGDVALGAALSLVSKKERLWLAQILFNKFRTAKFEYSLHRVCGFGTKPIKMN